MNDLKSMLYKFNLEVVNVAADRDCCILAII